MKKVVISLVGLYLLLQVVNIASHRLIFDRTNYEIDFAKRFFARGLFIPWLNFDGKNYLQIAKLGYKSDPVLAAFFPAYPIIIRLLSLNSVIDPIIVGLAVSFVCTLATIYFLYRLAATEFGKNVAIKTIALFIIFPASFFLFAYYTESLFLLLAISAFWFLNKRSFFWASIFVSLSTATRVVGLALIPPLLYEAYWLYKKKKRIAWQILIAPVGIFSYMAYLYASFGNPFLMITSQNSSRFARSVSIFSPLIELRDAIGKIIEGPLASYDSAFVYPVIILEFFFAVLLLAILVLSFRKMPIKYWIYMLFSALIILFSGTFASDIRYMLLIFPMFVFLAKYLPNKVFIFWSLISFLLLIFASSLFLRNYWIA